MIHKWFKRIMTIINCLFAVPVVLVLIRELTKPGPVKISRILGTLALVAIPLCATIAITITGSAVLSED